MSPLVFLALAAGGWLLMLAIPALVTGHWVLALGLALMGIGLLIKVGT